MAKNQIPFVGVSLEKSRSTQFDAQLSFPLGTSIAFGTEPNNGPIPSAKVGCAMMASPSAP
jgi:hypothetical protein